MMKSLSKIKNIFILIVVFGIVIISFLNPLLKKNKQNNWDKESKEFLFEIREKIQDEFDEKGNYLITTSLKLEKEIRKNENNLSNLLKEKNEANLYLHLFDDSFNLIFWRGNSFLDTMDQSLISKSNQTFFIKNKGRTYLTFLREIQLKGKKYYLFNSFIIEDLIKLNKSQSTFIDTLKEKFSADFEIDFNESAKIEKDGRKYSFPLINNYKNKIAVCSINYPTLSYEFEKIDFYTGLLQKILLLLLFLFLIFIVNDKIKNKFLLKNIFLGLGLIILRLLFFCFEIPSSIFKNELTNPANFSSRFGYGIVSSPLELFLTSVLITYLIFMLNKIIKYYNIEERVKNLPITSLWIITTILLFIYFMIWRGFGATLRSIIYDSTIRYFKEFNLIPDPVVLVMSTNILLIGFIFLSSAVIILNFILSIASKKGNIKYSLIIFFVVLQIFGFLFDYFQKLPQGTFLIRIIFISLTFINSLLIIKSKQKEFINFIYKLIFASIVSVTLLTYYNSELEKDSLKNYALDITRLKEPQISFMIYQTIENYTSINFEKINDYDVAAFQLWKKSLLKTEDLSLLISIYDENKNKLGEFTNTIGVNEYNYNLSDELKIYKIKNVFDDKYVLYGIKSIDWGITKKYILVAVPFYNSLPEKKIISLFRNEGKGITSSLNKINVLTFYLDNNGFDNSSEIFNIDESSLKTLKEQISKKTKENWLTIKINNDNYYTFSLLDEATNSKLVCVAKPVKSFSWNLSDFFKIFFLHAIIIVLIILLYLLINIKKIRSNFYSFRTKLSLTLIIISLIPMIIISNYVRTIIDENNEKIVYENLKNDALKIRSLVLSKNYNNYKDIYDQTKINFQIYQNKKLIYSTMQNLINIGILNKILNPNVYYKSVTNSEFIYFDKYNLNEKIVNTVFIKFNDYVIEVNDFEVTQNIYLSKYDFDLFLFGMLSFLIIALIIVSYLFSYQISKPIKKLNIVTNAVANGDLSLKVEINSKDEFSELANAFNNMTKKIKENQIELAQFERESAWKEMAKQVAHEIKNPLTPMKLLIQQLIASYNDKSDKFDEIFKKVTNTILNQIETLKNIASEFSNFARMPNLKLEKINLINSINEVISLFAYQDKSVKLLTEGIDVFINADKDHWKRTLINIIRNSFEANADHVEINVVKNDDFVILRIKDNGNGIPKENINKIFLPNFSTKESGMGLGMSMAKQFIDDINGTIIIESTNSNGTIIQIKIPLAKDE